MSALEKAARALCEQVEGRDDVWDDQSPADRKDYADMVRAVLMAVREPDDALVDEGVTGMAGANCAGRPLWAKQVRASHIAMIDAILRDHPLKGSGEETTLRSVPTAQDHKPAPQVEP